MLRNSLFASTLLTGMAAAAWSASAQPVSGIYVGAVGGANFMQREQVRVAIPTAPGPFYGKSGFDTGYVGIASIGYGFGNGLRIEAEGNYRRNDYGRSVAGVSTGGREEKYGAMANALFDLDIGSPYIYPYIGAGAGYARVNQSGRFVLPPFSGSVSGSENAFAYQAIAGLSFPIPPVVGLSLVAEYRYYAVLGDQTYAARVNTISALGEVKTRGDYNHALMLGLHYAFNVAPPPVEAPAAAPVPAAQVSRTYLVFFDWDRSDLTPRARQVVAEAAQATTRTQVTRIEVNGYTDTSGTASYNRGLSVRRAQTVANELVRDGVPRSAITTEGFGETRLLVPTAAGVREPQNRRVEIILR
ncbi:MAG: OmpA family protein [Acetobacteraceae bacterium]|nr:OmpA family protein [Acetobacteraceae bacterium]